MSTVDDEISVTGVTNDTSRDSTVVGRKNEVSKDVSNGSGIAMDCAEGEARRMEES